MKENKTLRQEDRYAHAVIGSGNVVDSSSGINCSKSVESRSFEALPKAWINGLMSWCIQVVIRSITTCIISRIETINQIANGNNMFYAMCYVICVNCGCCITIGKRVRKVVSPLLVAGALLAVPSAKGQMSWGWDLTANPNNAIGEVTIVNTNNGAIYDSYKIFLSDLANQIYSNNPTLHTNFSSGAELVASNLFSYTIRPGPISEVDQGWNATNILANGDIELKHRSFLYEIWYDSTANSAQDMQRGTLNVKKIPFLDLNGDGIWTATNDLSIVNDTNTVAVGGIGSDSGLFFFTDYIPRITVVKPTRTVQELSIQDVEMIGEGGGVTLTISNNFENASNYVDGVGDLLSVSWQSLTGYAARAGVTNVMVTVTGSSERFYLRVRGVPNAP